MDNRTTRTRSSSRKGTRHALQLTALITASALVLAGCSTDDSGDSGNGSSSGHFGRAFSVGPLANIALADLMVPLLADVIE